MTPKEKAQELLGKMNVIHYTKLASGTELPVYMHDDQVKQCALVAVDEMINNAGFIWGGRDTETGKSARDSYRTYWQEVKMELIKI